MHQFIAHYKRSEETFFQRRHADGQRVHEKMLIITNHQGNANQDHNETSPHTYQNGYYKKDKKRQVLVRIWRKGEPLRMVGGNLNWHSHYGDARIFIL